MERITMLHRCGSRKTFFSLNRKPLTCTQQQCKRSLVGARGFEPPTSCTPCKRASRTAPRPEQRLILYSDCMLLAMRDLHLIS